MCYYVAIERDMQMQVFTVTKLSSEYDGLTSDLVGVYATRQLAETVALRAQSQWQDSFRVTYEVDSYEVVTTVDA